MPKRKITLEEAFAVFEQHGLQVEVTAVQLDKDEVPLSAFLEDTVPVQQPVAEPVSNKLVKIALYATHSIGTGGHIEVDKAGNKVLVNNGVETYGPGIVTVPISLAHSLLSQDGLARQADERTFDRKFRSFVIVPKVNHSGMPANCGVQVSEDSSFDLSSLLGKLGTNGTYII